MPLAQVLLPSNRYNIVPVFESFAQLLARDAYYANITRSIKPLTPLEGQGWSSKLRDYRRSLLSYMSSIIMVLYWVSFEEIHSLFCAPAGPITVTGVAEGSPLIQPSPHNYNPSEREVFTLDLVRQTEVVFRAASLPSSQWVVTAIFHLTGVATTWLQEPTVYNSLTAFFWETFTR